MKKILLTLLSLLLLAMTIHLSTPSYGRMQNVWHRAQGRIVSYYAGIIHDPGACALIRGYWGRSIHEKLRDRCVANYIHNVVDEKSDCHIDGLVVDMGRLSHFWLRDEYRYACLLRHYQAMLGNSITQNWLPPVCLEVRDKLVVMQHYLDNIRTSRVSGTGPLPDSPLSEEDISVIGQCEGFLDTPQIYQFLRDDAYTESEEFYINSQKQKAFKFQ